MAHIYFCDTCREFLESHSTEVANIYEHLCDLYICSRMTGLYLDGANKETKIALNTTLKFLEMNKFILTTEAYEIDKTAVKLRPLGHSLFKEDVHIFCALNCKKEIISNGI